MAYNLDFWEPVQRKLRVDGRVVKCDGFHSMNPHTVTAIGANSGRVTLLVVSPSTPDDAAEAMLRAAAGRDNTATVEDILAGNGVHRTPAADAIPSQRWEGEGGSVHGGQPDSDEPRSASPLHRR